jgi:hypothetical protein
VGRRALLAEQVARIKHWTAHEVSYENLPVAQHPDATWFVDPPYQGSDGTHYSQDNSSLNFTHLGDWCRSLPGQVIVCENTGADWLPFEHLAYGKAGLNRPGWLSSAQALWTSDPRPVQDIFDLMAESSSSTELSGDTVKGDSEGE